MPRCVATTVPRARRKCAANPVRFRAAPAVGPAPRVASFAQAAKARAGPGPRGGETGIAVPVLVKTFGQHLFGKFVVGYPTFFTGVTSGFDFLRSIERHIHVEVKKLYPDAELPAFEYESPSADRLIMTYRSSRGLADFAEGLMIGCFAHFGEKVNLAREDLSGNGTEVRFTLDRRGVAE